MTGVSSLIRSWKQENEKTIRFVAFGSSNTELTWRNAGCNNWVDWVSMSMRQQIGHHIAVINQGISGETTKDLLGRIRRDVLSFEPSLVVITIGGNDAFHLTAEEYARNLKRICEILLERGITPVLQTYYCPYYKEGESGYRHKFEAIMNQKRVLAKELNLLLIDQYQYFEPLYRADMQSYKALMADWLHLSPLGNLIMGLHAVRSLGLEDFPMPEERRKPVLELLKKLEDIHGKQIGK